MFPAFTSLSSIIYNSHKRSDGDDASEQQATSKSKQSDQNSSNEGQPTSSSVLAVRRGTGFGPESSLLVNNQGAAATTTTIRRSTRAKDRAKRLSSFLSLKKSADKESDESKKVVDQQPEQRPIERAKPADPEPPQVAPSQESYQRLRASIPIIYLPTRSVQQTKNPIRRARLAEPEVSISDVSEPGTAPPSPPIPSEYVYLSPPVLRRRQDSFASARDIFPTSEEDVVEFTVQEPEPTRPIVVTSAIQTGPPPQSPTTPQTSFQIPVVNEPDSDSAQRTLLQVPDPRANGLVALGKNFWRRRLTVQSTLSGAETIMSTSPTSTDAMKWAFYNMSVFAMAICSILGAIAAYFLFYEFVKPAMWALICGIVLYPLKRQLTGVVKRWLDHLNENGTPLTFAIAALPLDLTNRIGEFLLDSMTTNLKMVLLMVAAFPMSALILHFETIPRSLVTAKRVLFCADNVMAWFSGKWVPILLIAYLAYICICNFVRQLRHPLLCHLAVSWAVWSAGIAHGCNYFGPFRTPIFLALMIICCTYYFPLFGAAAEDSKKAAFTRVGRRSTKRRHRHRSSATGTARDSVGGGNRNSEASTSRSPANNDADKSKSMTTSMTSGSEEDDTSAESNMYLKRLFIACFFVYVSLHLWIMFILIVPIGVAIARRIVVKFDICAVLERYWQNTKAKLGSDSALLFPTPFLHVFRVLLHIDRQVIYYLRQSMDLVGSLTAMILLLVMVASLAGFITFQLYYESMHLINLTADIANQTLTKNPGLQKWLRQTVQVDSVAELANEAVQRAYGMSRNWLSVQMQEIVQNDPEKAKLLESQVVNTLDTFFHNWLISRNSTNTTALVGGPSGGHKTAIAQWADVWTALGESGGDLDWNFLDNFHEYLSLIWSVADSAWMIVKNNMEVLVIGFSQIASTLLASGTAVVDFFLDSIVFLTFLLYLLCESDQEYKPLRMIRDLVPSGQQTAHKITEQVEQAVNGVFLATSKMAIFYGMFTWLTHTLFAVNLVFIPSVLAAAFAAIPFFGTYLVALPAILELWLIRGEPFLAVFLFVLHYIPSYVVDDAIYSDIRLTTPLLSGMAIAGGMLWWGLEGAIFGPLVLCCILVLGGVYKAIFFKTMTAPEYVMSPKDESDLEGEKVATPRRLSAHAIHTNGDARRDA